MRKLLIFLYNPIVRLPCICSCFHLNNCSFHQHLELLNKKKLVHSLTPDLFMITGSRKSTINEPYHGHNIMSQLMRLWYLSHR